MFRTGQTIGQYTLINQLGRGGFGEVWLAEKRTKFVTTRVAVKLPLDEQVDHETIKHEATLWQQASGHPNILPIIDADEYDGQIVIVSEYAPDGSLEQLLKKNGKLEIKQAVEMTIGILNGLEFLHSRNIIHRDLKPANILLQGETPRLADFGISRAMRATMTSQSQNISGTFSYMSPEALDGRRSVQTDIWSVGVNLYQFLTGELPFAQKEPSQLFPAIIMREFAPLPPEIPKNLQNVISKALAKLPENRHASANEMREDLHRVLRGETVSDVVQTDLPKTQQSFPALDIPPTQKVPPNFARNFQDENETVIRSAPNIGQSEKRKNSNVWMYATLALALVSAIGLGVYFLASQLKQYDLSENQISISSESNQNIKVTNNSMVLTNNINNKNSVISFVNNSNKDSTNSTVTERETVKIVLKAIFYSLGKGEMTSMGMPVILTSSKGKIKKQVSDNGKFAQIVFDSVPCNEIVTIQISDLSYQPDYIIPVTYKRLIPCNKPIVNLGKLAAKETE